MTYRLLAIADPHQASRPTNAPPERRCAFGAELLRRVIADARRHGAFDAIVLLGDLLNDGRDTVNAARDLDAIASALSSAASGIPVLAVPGNHDAEAGALFGTYGWLTGPQALGGCRFFVFRDHYEAGDVCSRPESERAAFAAFAAPAGAPVIALQHNPLMPLIGDPYYPYNFVNRDDILNDYERHGVLLSLSGHYHAGSDLLRNGSVQYLTVPCVCEAPYPYRIVSIEGGRVTVTEHALALEPADGLIDSHAHTEFAYCGQGISAAGAIERARMFGLAGVCLVEHAPQLYVTADDFWAGRHVRQPGMWRHASPLRMEAYLDAMAPLSDGFTRIGLEVEIDAGGELILRDEDRARVDLLVGALHFMVGDWKRMTLSEFDAAFLTETERLLSHGVDILAHPTRLYGARGREVPGPVRAALVELLAATGTAAEINFHLRRPDVEFLELCVARGVKLAVGSDAHVPEETADLHDHLALLQHLAQDRPLRQLLAPLRRHR